MKETADLCPTCGKRWGARRRGDRTNRNARNSEYHAAKALGTSPGDVRKMALAAFGRPLNVERDARSPNTTRQARGHITRRLIEELREATGAIGETV